MTPAAGRTIVLAKLEGREIISRRGRTDLGEPHRFETVYIPVTVIWLNDGTEEDIERARAYAQREGYRVLTYPQTEPDPLTRAKTDIYGGSTWIELEHLR